MPIGGPVGEYTANAVTRLGRALLKIELDTFALNAYPATRTSIVTFLVKEKFSGSAGSADGSGCR